MTSSPAQPLVPANVAVVLCYLRPGLRIFSVFTDGRGLPPLGPRFRQSTWPDLGRRLNDRTVGKSGLYRLPCLLVIGIRAANISLFCTEMGLSNLPRSSSVK